MLLTVARLNPEATIATASADLSSVAAALAQEYPATNHGYGVTIEPFRDAIVGSDLRTTSLLFLGVVGFVLLICCANVANLLLVRATVRGRELAVRTSLGATRRRIVRQLVTESLLLACIGGVLGVAVGIGLLAIAPVVVPAGLLPGAVALTFDTRVLTFCAAAVLFVGITFGLAPAWQAARATSAQAQISESRTTTLGGRHLRNLLVVAEVATAVLLLFGAGLLLRTLAVVDNIDRGYRAEGTLTMVVDPLGSSYPTAPALQQFFDQVENEIRAIAGVKDVAWASTLPLGASFAGQFSFDVLGNPPVDPANRPTADYQIVSRSYFSTLDLPIVQGRPFEEHDTRDRTPVCIVNEAFAQRHFGGRSAIGAQVALRPAGAPQATPVVREIVGVARQVKGRPDESDDLLQVYVPMTQQLMDDMFLVVQPSSGSGSALASSVRAAIARVDKAQLVGVRSVRTLEDVAWTATARHRFRAVLVVTFAALALTLAMVGVFGTLAYTVQQRRREFGLRMALGATGTSVFNLVLANAARVVVAGVVLGLLLAAMSARTLQSVLFGVEPWDATTFALVTVVLGVTALAASAAPAWRATRVDPSQTLRQD
jgi:putative ABC transport system permease protein